MRSLKPIGVSRTVTDEITAVADESTSAADESTAVADESTAVAGPNAQVHHIRRTSLDDDS